ncbi:MAG: outer membrane lipoprotein-sorting protein [Spirochaetales bacterium]|nr:outer membrane lipoprotein-sorting protein [Spirochaetales bacterium]
MRFALSRLKRPALAACLGLAAAAALHAQSSGEFLTAMKSLLAPDRDFYARVSVFENGADRGGEPAAEFFYFRSDARPAFLLYQSSPPYLTGLAYLLKNGALQGFNPDCGCASETYQSVMYARAGFSFDELNPLALAARTPRGAASPGRVGGEAAVVIVLSPSEKAEPDLRLSLSAERGLPLRLEYLDDKGVPFRTVEYLAYFEIGKRYFPSRIRATDRGGRPLLAVLSDASRNPLPDFVFTKAYLEELGK